MPRTTNMRFLPTSSHERGDLFARLMKDFFRAAGYDDLRLNMYKFGQEIDVIGQHRHASRLLLAECKAQDVKIDGTALNKFFGVVLREQRRTNEPVDAYFVSLGGFTEAARQQEAETENKRLILLDSAQIIAELEQRGLLVEDEVAVEQAGQCAGRAGFVAESLSGVELVVTEKGYIKVIYYAQQGRRTHFALIYADGTPLALAPAQEVVDADQADGGILRNLIYLPPIPVVADLRTVQEEALAHYQRWLLTECSYIQLDGLPADADVSASKPRLERLFIPLKALPLRANAEEGDVVNPNPVLTFDDFEYDADDDEARESISDFIVYSKNPEPISQLLAPTRKLAFLAPPGGGKSTLLKRLATEYGFAERVAHFADQMPDHDWLPLLIRCRDLQDRAKRPFMKVLKRLPKQLNMLPEQAAAFKAYIDEALQLGRVLLLLDGLDEIAKEQNRKIFANNLHNFLTLYPQVTLVLTSREAGFRLVADVIASVCEEYKLAPFSKEDVQRLCVQWHVEVINDSPEVRNKAVKLADAIWKNKHIRQLAINPLLLTTLFVVNRRRGGELPKNRLLLYSKAVEVLVQTWNTEAFEALDEEETLAQLSYLACYMMERDMQRIGRRELLRVLKEAKQAIPELRFMTASPANFVKLVEYRSSLLMQVGSDLIDDEEQELFEFRHLTFQEYLAAKGYVDGFHPRNKEEIPLVELLAPHFGQASWREVIPLATGLAKRQADFIIQQLVDRCKKLALESNKPHTAERATVDVLRRCILDEVLVSSSELLDEALRMLALLVPSVMLSEFTDDIQESKFDKLYRRVIEQAYLTDVAGWNAYEMAFAELSVFRLRQKCGNESDSLARESFRLLDEKNSLSQLRGLAVLGNLGLQELTGLHRVFGDAEPFVLSEAQVVKLYSLLDQLLYTADERLLAAAVDVLAYQPGILPPDARPPATTIASLFRLLGELEKKKFSPEVSPTIHRRILIALHQQPLLERRALIDADTGSYLVGMVTAAEFIMEKQLLLSITDIQQLLLLAGWYHLIDMQDTDLVERVNDRYEISRYNYSSIDKEDPGVVRILSALGKLGEHLLVKRAAIRQQLKEDNTL